MNSDNGRQGQVSDTTCFDNYGKGWQVVRGNFVVLLLVTLIMVAVDYPVDSLQSGEHGAGWVWFAMVFGIFVAGPLGMGASWVFLRSARGEETRIGDMFSVFSRNYWNAVAAGVLTVVIVCIGLVFLIVPGIILACRLAFVNYLIMDRRMGALESIKTSWDMTSGHGWTIFGMALLMIPIAMLGLLALIVGIFVAIMWFSASYAVLYHSVCVRKGLPAGDDPTGLPAPEAPVAG